MLLCFAMFTIGGIYYKTIKLSSFCKPKFKTKIGVMAYSLELWSRNGDALDHSTTNI